MASSNDDAVFLTIDSAAYRLGVPVAWLKREAKYGRVPSLLVGNRLMLNLEQTKATLLKQAEEEAASDRKALEEAAELAESQRLRPEASQSKIETCQEEDCEKEGKETVA